MIAKGDAAGISMMPKFMTKKLFLALQEVGRDYEVNHRIEPSIMGKLQPPKELSKGQVRLGEFLHRFKINRIIWNKMMKNNGVLEEALVAPFGIANQDINRIQDKKH